MCLQKTGGREECPQRSTVSLLLAGSLGTELGFGLHGFGLLGFGRLDWLGFDSLGLFGFLGHGSFFLAFLTGWLWVSCLGLWRKAFLGLAAFLGMATFLTFFLAFLQATNLLGSWPLASLQEPETSFLWFA